MFLIKKENKQGEVSSDRYPAFYRYKMGAILPKAELTEMFLDFQRMVWYRCVPEGR
jgi:hypothetical protein